MIYELKIWLHISLPTIVLISSTFLYRARTLLKLDRLGFLLNLNWIVFLSSFSNWDWALFRLRLNTFVCEYLLFNSRIQCSLNITHFLIICSSNFTVASKYVCVSVSYSWDSILFMWPILLVELISILRIVYEFILFVFNRHTGVWILFFYLICLITHITHPSFWLICNHQIIQV